MVRHKYDSREAYKDGILAEELYKLSCEHRGISLGSVTVEQNCSGIDYFKGQKKIDVKSRKRKKPPHMATIELSAAKKSIGTGWAYKDTYTAQMMVYEDNEMIKDVIFGEFYNPDLLENLLNKKVDFIDRVEVQTLYKVRARYFKGEHCGDTTLVTYDDLESLETFTILQIPREYWDRIIERYEYKGIL